MAEISRTLLDFAEVGQRWGVSLWTVRRLVERGELPAINIGARRLISLREVERAEQSGIGVARKRKAGSAGTLEVTE